MILIKDTGIIIMWIGRAPPLVTSWLLATKVKVTNNKMETEEGWFGARGSERAGD